MDKQFRKDFCRWLDTASVGELFARRDRMYEVVRSGDMGEQVVKLAKRCINLVNLELDARAEAASFSVRYKRQKAAA
jgi:hypothetical protein